MKTSTASAVVALAAIGVAAAWWSYERSEDTVPPKEAPEETEPGSGTSEPVVEVSDEALAQCGEIAKDACPGDVWVGIDKTPNMPPSCPTPPPAAGWATFPLFSDVTGDLPVLAEYCLYTKSGGTDLPTDWPLWNQDLQDLDKDCAIVGPAAPERHSQWLIDEFYREAGRPEGDRDSTSPVRLAFVDTGPTNSTNPQVDVPYAPSISGPSAAIDPECSDKACSPHGFWLVNMARRMLCRLDSDEGCGNVSITSRLAMPRINVAGELKKRDEGGVAGYLSDLAQAVDLEVDEWEHDARPDKLVLNLSLGWEPCFGGVVEDAGGVHKLHNPPVTVKAAHDALENAACKGALIVAAAGNFQGPLNYGLATSDVEPGPTIPGAWEALPRSTDSSCETLPDGAYAPLLYAVGAVDRRNKPIANSRPLSRPRLVAFGDHAVIPVLVPAQDPKAPREFQVAGSREFTGTSVATGLVSVAAAARWSASTASDLTGPEIMESIWQSATKLDPMVTADPAYMVPDTVNPMTKRVHVSGAAPTTDGTEPGDGRDIPEGDWKSSGPTLSSLTLDATAGAGAADSECHNEIPHGDPGCPHWALPGIAATPWGGPQPGNNPCMGCSGKPGSGVVLIELDPTFTVEGSTPTINEIALVVGPDVTDTDWDSSSAPADENSDRYDLSGMGLNFTDQRTGKVCIDFLATDSLLLVMKLTLGASGEERSVVSPILVLPNDDEADTEFDAADFCSGD
jgi:hypothetical protein